MKRPSIPEVFRSPDFTRYFIGRLLHGIAALAQSVTLGWQVYVTARLTHDINESAFLVGMIGLAQFLPMFALTLLAGETADRYDRRKVMLASCVWQFLCVVTFFILSCGPHSLFPLYIVAALFGVGLTFFYPAARAIVPDMVPAPLLSKALAWNYTVVVLSRALGPWLAGLLILHSVTFSFGGVVILYVLVFIFYLRVETVSQGHDSSESRFALMREGLAYVWSNKVVFGAISLDLFAVLLGGVTTLLPVYAKDILHVGADGFGLLRAAPSIGGIATMLYLIRYSIKRDVGIKMLLSVGVFGAATCLFAFSSWMGLSLLALVVLGAADSVSGYVRQILIQMTTPNALMGRVGAVSSLFIGASNELGEFESGVAARFLGPIGSALFGGVGSIIVTGLWAKLFPALRKADRLEGVDDSRQ